jgi:hypothetical protein
MPERILLRIDFLNEFLTYCVVVKMIGYS